MVTTVRLWAVSILALVAAAAVMPAFDVDAAGPRPEPVDRAVLEQIQGLPAPHLPADAPMWSAQRLPQQLIDDFESSSWPDRATWVIVGDLNGVPEFFWAPRPCRAANGTRALWSVGGGADGVGLSCGSPYPDESVSSALLWLNLTGLRSVTELELAFDIWADAAPNEGLFINYMTFNFSGVPTERRTIYSATGHTSDWARGVRIDVTDLRDRLDAPWRFDGRGKHLLLEFLFVSASGTTGGEGIFLDNLSLASVEPTPIIIPPDTPVPTPPPSVNLTVACSGGPDCGTLSIRAFVDSRCDGRYQGGIDDRVRSQPRVDIVAGTEVLGGKLSGTGSGFFRLPFAAGVEVRFEVPDGYEMCANSPNPAILTSQDFGPFGRAKVDFGVKVKR